MHKEKLRVSFPLHSSSLLYPSQPMLGTHTHAYTYINGHTHSCVRVFPRQQAGAVEKGQSPGNDADDSSGSVLLI